MKPDSFDWNAYMDKIFIANEGQYST